MKLKKLKSFIKSEDGYTTAEGLVAILIVAALGLSGAFTFRKIEQNKNDIKLKTNIESTYYGLEYIVLRAINRGMLAMRYDALIKAMRGEIALSNALKLN